MHAINMAEGNFRKPNICPRCSAPVESGRVVGCWTGVDKVKNVGLEGPSYGATCGKCGTELWSFPTYAATELGEFYWEVRVRNSSPKKYPQVKRELEALLNPLLASKAGRDLVVTGLGLVFTDFS